MDDAIPPGMPGNPVKLTDPRAMRALAHPARMKILAYLGLRGSATATECAEYAEISPSACSYHLRALAKYGFVEEDPDSAADGRQRPWRVRILAMSFENVSGNPAADVAARFLAETFRADHDETRARYLTRQPEYPVAWQRAAGEDADVAFVTPEELTQMRERIRGVIDEYRRLDPAERPPGTLPVRLLFDMFPWFGPEEAR